MARTDIPALIAEIRQLRELFADDIHLIRFTDDGWTIAHPLSERLEHATPFDCPVRWTGADPNLRGVFEFENGALGQRISEDDQ